MKRNREGKRLRAYHTTERLLALAMLLALPSFVGCKLFGPSTASHTASIGAMKAGFTDVTVAAGLKYTWVIPGKRPLNILQTIGNGCAFLDYDNDGNLDILLVGYTLALYKGDGHGHFTDVTHQTGLDKLHGHFLGCAVGDYDHDGYDDLYISAYRGGVLLHNEAGKGYKDVTVASGIKPQPWGTGAAWVESVPGSGRLDLYVANYVHFDPSTDKQLCPEHGIPTACGPRAYALLRGILYRNDGRGRFLDITQSSGLAAATGRALGVGFLDYNGSGKPGLALANDELAGDLFQPTSQPNDSLIHYRNTAQNAGTAFDGNGNAHAGMGLDWGDYDNDGKPDLFVATYQNELKCLYHNEGDGYFKDMSQSAGLETTIPFVAFGCKFLDYDNDGWLDLLVTNGHVLDNVTKIFPKYTYRQPTQLLHNRGASIPPFEDVSQRTGGSGFMKPIVGRGAAIGDYDNDGRIDVLLVDSEGTPVLLHNECQTAAHWLGLKLIGTKSNRDGYGASVTVELADGRRLVRYCHADGSYMSSSDKRVHIGLGTANRVKTLRVQWPGGHTDMLQDLAVDRYIEITEGKPPVL